MIKQQYTLAKIYSRTLVFLQKRAFVLMHRLFVWFLDVFASLFTLVCIGKITTDNKELVLYRCDYKMDRIYHMILTN